MLTLLHLALHARRNQPPEKPVKTPNPLTILPARNLPICTFDVALDPWLRREVRGGSESMNRIIERMVFSGAGSTTVQGALAVACGFPAVPSRPLLSVCSRWISVGRGEIDITQSVEPPGITVSCHPSSGRRGRRQPVEGCTRERRCLIGEAIALHWNASQMCGCEVAGLHPSYGYELDGGSGGTLVRE